MNPGVDQSFGSLVEGIHLAGYSLERAFQKLEWLIEGDRWKTVGDGFEDVNAFLDTSNLIISKYSPSNGRRLPLALNSYSLTHRTGRLPRYSVLARVLSIAMLSQMGHTIQKTPAIPMPQNPMLSQMGH